MQEPAAPTLYIDRAPASTAAVLLAALSGTAVERHFVQDSSDLSQLGITQPLPVLKVSAKETYSGYAAIAQFLGKAAPHILGKSDGDKAEVAKWFSWPAEVGDVHSGFDKQKHMKELSKVSKLLLTKVYLVSNHLTAADVVVFATLIPLMAGIDAHTRSTTLAAVSRFFDFLQHQPQILAVLAAVNLSVVEFDLNYPFNPKPPAQDKSKGAQAKPAPQASTSTSQPAASRPAKQSGSAPPEPTEGDKAAPADKGKGKAKPQPQAARQPKQPKKAPGSEAPDIARLDIRVGRILKVAKHPDAATLYVEEIDLGEGTPRQVVSGLVAHVPEDQMLNARVVCLCNLKPAKMRGVMSHAMVLCASTPDKSKVELLIPPEGAAIGEHIIFETFEGHKPDDQLNPKRKIFETVQPNFFIRDDLVACYRDPSGTPRPFNTSAGPCKAATIVGGNIS